MERLAGIEVPPRVETVQRPARAEANPVELGRPVLHEDEMALVAALREPVRKRNRVALRPSVGQGARDE